MLIALCLSALMQSPPPQAAGPISHRPALPALAAKAPGKPEYGIHINSPQGQFIFTNLNYTHESPKGGASVYRVIGPAGLGPYRLGVELGGPTKYVNPEIAGWHQGNFFDIKKAVQGGAAQAAGLDEDWSILSVDGQDFGWDINALIAYMTTRPSIQVLALKAKGWGLGTRQKTFQIPLRKLDPPADPADGILASVHVEALQPYLMDSRLWSELAARRSALPRFSPLSLELSGKPMWALRGVANPSPVQGQPAGPIILEIWGEDPASGPKKPYPTALCADPQNTQGGQVLKVENLWYRIQDLAVDGASGRLQKLTLQPWTPEVPGLLAGAEQSRALGPHAPLEQREALDQLANEVLVEWKTRSLPGLLATQDLGSTEDLVIRIEKGLLKMDLEVKGIRTRLDILARAEAERTAKAELAAKGGAAAPRVAAAATESERLADLLDQRKAILMAILGSAKQALANLRR